MKQTALHSTQSTEYIWQLEVVSTNPDTFPALYGPFGGDHTQQ